MATKATTEVVVDEKYTELQKENENLKKQIEEQSKNFNLQLEEIKKMLASTPKVENNSTDEINSIRPDKYIKVMSLTHSRLNLNAGNGKIIRINHYGDVMNIMHGDLVNIVNNHYKLACDGGFYIFDKDAVTVSGLLNYYEKILDKDGIEELLNKTPNEVKEILSNLSEVQKESIVNTVVQLIYNGKDVSTSIVDAISKACEKNIMSKVDEMENFDKEVKELEEKSK